MKRFLMIFGLVLLIALPSGWAGELIVASWNVENLFDPVDDPDNKYDDGYTPTGWARWTEERYQGKLERLAEVISDIKPDILCLSEVENRKVLEDLATVLKNKYGFSLPEIIHRDGGDMRGIDVAMMAKYKPVVATWVSAIFGQRDVLACDFLVEGHELTVIVNHWKSKLGKKEVSDQIRNRQARSVRAYIDKALDANPGAAIIVTGDFNSDIDTSFLTQTAGFLTDLEAFKDDSNRGHLYNLAGALTPQARATYYYSPHQRWSSLDSISVTRGMMGLKPVSDWRFKTDSYQVYRPEKLCFTGVGSPLPYRRVRSKKYGDRFVDGYSDHFAVYAVFYSGN